MDCAFLCNIDHRGARGAEEKTGDGAGMLLQKPHEFFHSEIPTLGDFDSYGVGQLFVPKDQWKQIALKKLITTVCREAACRLIYWREVPTDNSDLGRTALLSEPAVRQMFIEPIEPLTPEQLDTRLYVLRRLIEKAVKRSGICGKATVLHLLSRPPEDRIQRTAHLQAIAALLSGSLK